MAQNSQFKLENSDGSENSERLVQIVNNLPAMQETWVRSLAWKDPLEKGMATHSSILGLPWWLSW